MPGDIPAVLVAVLSWILLASCSAGNDSDTAVTTDPFCDGAPTETFETFGGGFITEACQSCHASTSSTRMGAPASVYFDDGTGETDVHVCWSWAERILARAASDPATMPPVGGTTADDRYRLEVWLRCAEPGT